MPSAQLGSSTVDWAAFADALRAGYRPAMDRVRRGDLPWMNIDALHRLILDATLQEFGIRKTQTGGEGSSQPGVAPAAPVAGRPPGLDGASSANSLSPRCPTATSLCSPTWPSTAGYPGTASSPPSCSVTTTSPTARPTWEQPALLGVEATRDADGCHPCGRPGRGASKRGCAPPSSGVPREHGPRKANWPRNPGFDFTARLRRPAVKLGVWRRFASL